MPTLKWRKATLVVASTRVFVSGPRPCVGKNYFKSTTQVEYLGLKVDIQQKVSKRLALWAISTKDITLICQKVKWTSTDKIEIKQNGLCYSFFLSFHNSGSMRIGLFFKTGLDNILGITTTE